MKDRKHHNNKGYRSTQRGNRKREVAHMAWRLNIPYGKDKETNGKNEND